MMQMKQVRKLDELGRIALPADVRESFCWQTGDKLEVIMQEDGILLRKQGQGCMFCGDSEDLLHYQKHLVCANCAKSLFAMAGAEQEA